LEKEHYVRGFVASYMIEKYFCRAMEHPPMAERKIILNELLGFAIISDMSNPDG
jgi:hypothetical protein